MNTMSFRKKSSSGRKEIPILGERKMHQQMQMQLTNRSQKLDYGRERKLTGIYAMSIFLLMLIFAFSAGCDTGPSPGTASLTIVLNDGTAPSRTLLPETSITVAYYTVSGTGPGGGEFSVSTQNADVTIPGLETGTWQLTASGWNENNCRLITGESTIDLTPDTNEVGIILDEYYGTGTLSVIITWDAGRTYNADLVLFLSAKGENEAEAEVTPTVASGSASFETTLEAGSYLLRGVLYSNGEPLAGFVEAVRISDSSATGGTVAIDLDTLVSNLSASLENNTSLPVQGSISGIPDPFPAGTSVNLTFTPENVPAEDLGSLTAAWYLDGLYLGTGLTQQISPDAGTHRIDVLAHTSKAGSTGSASSIFLVSPEAEGGSEDDPPDPLTVSIISDNSNGAMLDGAEYIEVLPDGLIITASRVDDALQTWRIENSSLVLKQTLVNPADYLLNGVQEISSTSDGSLVFAISDYSKSISIFSHAEGSDSLELVETYDSSITIGENTYNFGMLNSITVDSDSQNIYILDRYDHHIYHYIYDGTEVVPVECYSYLTNPLIEQPKSISLSPDGLWMAVASYTTNALFIFAIDPLTQIPAVDTILTYADTGTMGIGDINYAVFADNTTLLTTSQDYFSVFKYGEPSPGEPAVWHQTQRISEGSGAEILDGPKHINICDDNNTIYISNSISAGLSVFTRNSVSGEYEYSSFIELAPFIPTMSVCSADGNFIISPSSSMDELALISR